MDVSKLKFSTGRLKEVKFYPPEIQDKCVAICNWAPRWKRRWYRSLAPKKSMGDHYDWASYAAAYQREVLDTLDPAQVANSLGDGAVLICYEEAGAACHRRLVAEWLEKHLGIEVPEYGYPRGCLFPFVESPDDKYALEISPWAWECYHCDHEENIRLDQKAGKCSNCGESFKVVWE